MNATHPTFDIITPHATIALAPGQFAIEITPDGITRVISAAGEANARIADAVMPVPAGYGLRFQDELTQPVVLAAPPHFARLDATLDGCVGRIRVVGDEPLYVRIGPGLDYEPIGVLENDTPVVLMAVSPNRDRYRIQYLSGFAWILATGVQTQCQNLPVLPYDTFEIIAGLNQPRAEELALLLPFFGAPKDDVWFYRIVAP